MLKEITSLKSPEIVEMRSLGKKIVAAVRDGQRFDLPTTTIREGISVTESSHFQYLRAKEVGYTATNPFTRNSVSETWLSFHSGLDGVTVLPLITFGGRKCPVMIFKPQPAVGRWSLELPSGCISSNGETLANGAARELREETGLQAASLRAIGGGLDRIYHAPYRLATSDAVVLAEGLKFVGRGGSLELEEKPISTLIVTPSEVEFLLDRNVIFYSISVAVLQTYLARVAQGRLEKMLRAV